MTNRSGHYDIARPRAFGGDITATTSAQEFPLGTIREYYENLYVYCKAGAVALSPGLIAVTPAITSLPEVEDTVTVAHAAGTKDVTITAGGTYTEDQYRDGYLWVDEGTGIGECHRIATHPAVASGSTFTVTLAEPLVTAWSTSDTDVSMSVSPYRGVLVAPTDSQSHAVCVPQWAVTASYYFWGLVRGYGAIKIDIGTGGLELDEKAIVQSTNHAGQGLIDDSPASQTANTTGMQIIGYNIIEKDLTNDKAWLCYIDLL